MKVSVLLIAAATLAVVVLVGDQPAGEEQPSVLLKGSTGALEVKSERSGSAVVTGTDMAPGKKVKGRVSVSVNRTSDMELWIDRVTHSPGASGADLADSLKMNVRRIGRGPGRRHVYRGLVETIDGLELGRWKGGSSYRYRVRLKMPYTKASQNELQGASSQFRLRWRAYESE